VNAGHRDKPSVIANWGKLPAVRFKTATARLPHPGETLRGRLREAGRGRKHNGIEVLWNPPKKRVKTWECEAPAEPPNAGARCKRLSAFLRSSRDGCGARGGDPAQQELRPPDTAPCQKVNTMGRKHGGRAVGRTLVSVNPVRNPCFRSSVGRSLASDRPRRVCRRLVTDKPAHVAASLISDQPLPIRTPREQQMVQLSAASRTRNLVGRSGAGDTERTITVDNDKG